MKKDILFIDDEPNFLSGLKRMLRSKRDEWTLHFANSVDEAIELIRHNTFDTIVSDVSMPLKTGLDFLIELKDLDAFTTTPVIILTGNAEADLKRRALDLGATDLLNKPCGQEDLIARIHSTLRLKSFRDELANQNAILEIKVQERTADLELARRDIMWRLAKAGEYRDEETGDHVIRVALCSKALAKAVGLDDKTVNTIFLTSPLHDVGKIGIPDSILLKPGRLTDEERSTMESHCTIGAAILQDAPKGMEEFPEIPSVGHQPNARDSLHTMAMEIALTHHEKWDGSGYPYGLAGDDIPLSGQIVAIADVFDALRAERPYKKSFSYAKTISMMRQGVGLHFSSTVFEAFETIAEDFESIREGHSR